MDEQEIAGVRAHLEAVDTALRLFVAITEEMLTIVRFCAVECEMQQSGEESVAWMVAGWRYAMLNADRRPANDDVLRLGAMVEPRKNKDGFRQVPVRIGWDVKGDWRLVPTQMQNLIEAMDTLSPAEWFYEYEDVHPFRDGNGRTGQILFNWLNGTLAEPTWAPNFWQDDRRTPGRGAP